MKVSLDNKSRRVATVWLTLFVNYFHSSQQSFNQKEMQLEFENNYLHK